MLPIVQVFQVLTRAESRLHNFFCKHTRCFLWRCCLPREKSEDYSAARWYEEVVVWLWCDVEKSTKMFSQLNLFYPITLQVILFVSPLVARLWALVFQESEPIILYFFSRNGEFICGGTLINTQWIITAGNFQVSMCVRRLLGVFVCFFARVCFCFIEWARVRKWVRFILCDCVCLNFLCVFTACFITSSLLKMFWISLWL